MVKFRLANENDASEYAHILNKSWKDTYGEYISDEYIDQDLNVEKLISSFPNKIADNKIELYMIEVENKIVGIIELGYPDEFYKENMEEYGEILSFHIKKEFHNLGIGSKAIYFAEKRLLELGYKKFCLWVKKTNHNAIKFYKKHNYVETKYDCPNPDDGLASFVMEKKEIDKMKLFEQMWEELSPYLTCEKGLDEGYADGKYTRYFAKYCKNVVGIDLSEDFYKKAKENLKDLDNVELKIMDAVDVKYPDKYFDVILNTSFHEFDLSGDVFKMDFDLKTKMLKEMIRLSDTIVFAEVSPENLSGELYKVFNPVEEHSLRIAKSNELIDKVLKENGYELVLCDRAVDEIKFNNREEFENEMLAWWEEVKVPKDAEEKERMIKQIDEILETENMLTDLCFHDVFRYAVYKKISD